MRQNFGRLCLTFCTSSHAFSLGVTNSPLRVGTAKKATGSCFLTCEDRLDTLLDRVGVVHVEETLENTIWGF